MNVINITIKTVLDAGPATVRQLTEKTGLGRKQVVSATQQLCATGVAERCVIAGQKRYGYRVAP